ncbi:MAG TPA: MXAN_5187 C-terminal domain-containing protein, partial [Polyangiales bacterium]|nr:MXAN_5187 C-terminal domain-containing protein [Polyangiales bacterium]
ASPAAAAPRPAQPVAAKRAAAAVLAAGAKPGAPVAPKAPPSAANNGGSVLSSDDVQRIYSNYVAARKQNSERVDNVKLDNIEKTLRGMLPQLEKKHAGKKIDFEVVVKDGKVALKPVAK